VLPIEIVLSIVGLWFDFRIVNISNEIFTVIIQQNRL